MGITMSLDFELMKLIARGKKPDALYDIVRLIEDQKCVTIAILDAAVELQDKAIRNFVKKLEDLNFVEIMQYKIPGGRWVQLIIRKDAQFQIQKVVKNHLQSRKNHKILLGDETRFINDIPFQYWVDRYDQHLKNEELGVLFHYPVQVYDGKDCYKEFEKYVKRQLTKIQDNKLEQYLTKTHLVRNETGGK